MDKMRYHRHTIYSNTDKTKYKEFEINGKFNVLGLENLRKEGIVRMFPLTEEDNPEESPKETLIYTTPLEKIMIFTDYEAHSHKVNLMLKYSHIENPEMLEKITKLIEKRLECKLVDRSNPKKEEVSSGLLDKISDN